jgi:hypothetical protein
MRLRLMEQSPQEWQAWEMMLRLRAERDLARVGSDRWNRLVGGAVALIKRYPHFAQH